MAEDCRSDWPGDKPYGVDQKDVEGSHRGIGLGEEELGKDECGGGGVEKEVIPLDRRADRAGDDGSTELLPFVSRSRCHCHVQSPLDTEWTPTTGASHHLPSALYPSKNAVEEGSGSTPALPGEAGSSSARRPRPLGPAPRSEQGRWPICQAGAEFG